MDVRSMGWVMGRRVRLAAVAGLLAVGAAVTGCGSGGSGGAMGVPLAMMRNGDELIVFIGRQCDDAGYPTRVTVANYDRNDRRVTDPPLWEVETATPGLLPSVSLGRVPNGFTQVANNLGSQGVGATLKVDVELAETVTAAFDTARLVDGRVLQSTGDLVPLESFRRTYGCGT
jgi:hypothetical protein